MCTTTKYSVTERRRGHRHPSRRQNGRKSLQQREGGDHASCDCCPRLYHHSDRLSSSTAGQTTGRSQNPSYTGTCTGHTVRASPTNRLSTRGAGKIYETYERRMRATELRLRAGTVEPELCLPG